MNQGSKRHHAQRQKVLQFINITAVKELHCAYLNIHLGKLSYDIFHAVMINIELNLTWQIEDKHCLHFWFYPVNQPLYVFLKELNTIKHCCVWSLL